MKQRLSDTPENIAEESKPFVERHPLLDPYKVMGAIAVAFFICLIIAYNSQNWGHSNMVASITVVFMLLLGFFGFIMTHARNVVLANEFENALFAGANNAGVEFTIIANSKGQIVYVSPGCKLYFRSDIELRDENIDNLITIMGVDEIDKIHILSSFKAGTGTTRHIQLFDAFGFMQDVYLILRPISRPKGYLMLKAVKLDEELKQKDEDNKASHTLVQLVDAIPAPSYIAMENGSLLHVNSAFSELLGYEEGEIISEGMNLDELFFGHEVMEGDMLSQWEGKVALRRKDSSRPVKRQLRQVPLSQGEFSSPLICGFALPQKIKEESSTDPSEIDKALTEVWLKALEYAPISIAFLDGNATVTQCNRAFSELAGRPHEHGWNLADMVSHEQHGKLKETLDEVASSLAEETTATLDIKIAGEEEKNALLYLSPMGDDSDGFIAHLVDTTRQKKFEQTMAQSQKMHAVGQLAGGIAHDFNNLLTAMIGFCDLLLIRHPAGDPSFPDIMQIKQNSNRAANLVRQLLAFSRKQTLQPEIINVTEILAELSNLIRRLIGENIEFDIVYGSNTAFVKVDKVQFEQVIINLAVNARDAMLSGGSLTFETSNAVVDNYHPIDKGLVGAAEDEVIEDGKYILIKVADSGEGIAEDVIGNIFDPFFSTKDIGSGTGLGLATVYGIVKQTGGYIYVKSEPGKGTSFYIYLKSVNHEEAEQYFAEKKKDKDLKESDLTGKGTILLVEDEAPVRMFSVRALQNKGYDVLEAEHGEMALEIIKDRGKDIDLIITDVMMPGIDGPTMVEEIRETYPDVKVIFISGYGEDAFVGTYGSDREFEFLPKPYSLKDLASKVKEVML